MTIADILILFGAAASTLISFYLLFTMAKVWSKGRLAMTEEDTSN